MSDTPTPPITDSPEPFDTFFSHLYTRAVTRRQLLKFLLLLPAGCAMRGDGEQPPLLRTPDASARIAIEPIEPIASLQFSGASALTYAIAQMHYGPRIPGTEGWRQCGDDILKHLAVQGWEVESQPFRYRETDCRNLIGKRGTGPLLVIGAHYDTRRRADRDPDPACRDLPVPGANDGASGVAVLLELARILRPEELGRTIWLVAFDAEDNGGLDGWDWIAGSHHFVDTLSIPLQGMVLVDMIGDADQQIYYEGHSHPEMSRGIWDTANRLGYSSFVPELRHTMIDDHIPFVQAGIPAVDLIDFDYPYWHTTHDTIDKISAESLEAVGRTLEAWLLGGAEGLPTPSAHYRLYAPAMFR